MSRQSGSISWSEEHFVVYVHDVYQHPTRERVIEFYAEDGGMRVIGINDMRVVNATVAKVSARKERQARDSSAQKPTRRKARR